MALAHTILTVLCEQPRSGYAISKLFEETIACYWKASQQQIYRELAAMEAKGWLNHELVPQAGKPDKKVYALTTTGREELDRWNREPTHPTPIREDLGVRVLGGANMPPAVLIGELERRRRIHQQNLENYLQRQQEFQRMAAPSLHDQFRFLTLRRGIRYEQEWVAWCEEVRDYINEHLQDR
ncbi:MAG: PadR family transcriptional regulator [Cyanobacteria bacterium]|nr:PadR family transcriptional regulator [Cyanobacteria bacterium bin.51]